MSKETFQYPETKQVFRHVEDASQRSGVSRGHAFEDFLHVSVCALAGGRMEAEYLQTVARHTVGKNGERGCDHLARGFATLVDAMNDTRKDILGDLFEGAISHGENGLFLTPECVCDLMAQVTLSEFDEADIARKTIGDPCCGSGRMLLAAARIRPNAEFVGQDVDLRCVRITTINLALWNHYAHVIWGNTLTHEIKLVYRTGFDGFGVVRPLQTAEQAGYGQLLIDQITPADEANHEPMPQTDAPDADPPPRNDGQQLYLF